MAITSISIIDTKEEAGIEPLLSVVASFLKYLSETADGFELGKILITSDNMRVIIISTWSTLEARKKFQQLPETKKFISDILEYSSRLNVGIYNQIAMYRTKLTTSNQGKTNADS